MSLSGSGAIGLAGFGQTSGNFPLAIFAGAVVFLAAHIVGRLLKRRTGVRFGVIYQIFSATLGLLAALRIFGNDVADRDLRALAFFTGAFVLTALVNRFFWDLYFVRSGKPPVPKFFSQVFTLIIVVAAAILIITINYHQAGVISTVLTTGGVLALTIGLALQDLLGNIIAGFAIHFGRPFKSGDWLILDNTHVEVMEINWRSTRCRTNDNSYLDVPNTLITRQSVLNFSYPEPTHALRVRIGLEYDTPPNLAKECLFRAACNAPGVLSDPEPVVYLVDFADSSITYEIKACIGNHGQFQAIMDAIRTNAWYELKRKNLNIPFPQRVLHLNRGGKKTTPEFTDRIATLLKRQSSFSFLTASQLHRLALECETTVFGKGEKIIAQGMPGESMFLVLSGSVRVLVEHEATITQVAVLHEGECFGEMSLLTGETRSATIVAAEDAKVAELHKESLAPLVKSNPKFVEKLGQLLTERKIATDGKMAARGMERTAIARSYKASILGRLKAFFEI